MMNDRELLIAIKTSEGPNNRRVFMEELWERYENLVHKNWGILYRQMNGSDMIRELHDDYYSEAYVAFTKAVAAIRLEKLLNDKWKFIGYFRLYLKNVRADMIDRLLKIVAAEKTFYVETADGEVARIDMQPQLIESESAYYDPVKIFEKSEAERNCARAVEECMLIWDDRRKEIYRLRERGVAKGEIAKMFGVHASTISYYLESMKKDLELRLYS